MKNPLTLAFASTVLAATLAAAPTVQAAPSASSSAAVLAQAPDAGASFSDGDLRKFVAAARQIDKITQEYTPKIESAPSEADQRILMQQADQDMVRAVRSEDISVEKFLEINQ